MPVIDWSGAAQPAPVQAQPTPSGAIDWSGVNTKAPVQTVPVQSAPSNSLSWPSALGEAVLNIPSSAGNLVANVYHAIRHPLDTGMTMLDAGAGAIHNILPAPLQQWDTRMAPVASRRAVNTADQLGHFYANRYGSAEGFKQAVAQDPVGVLADASMALGGTGALLRGGSRVADTAANLATQAGASDAAVSPISATSNVLNQAANVASAGSRLANPVTPAMAAIKPVAKAATGAYNATVKPFTNPNAVIAPLLDKVATNSPLVDKYLNTLGPDAPPLSPQDALVQALRNYGTPVPGSQATFAQAVRTPQAILLEKTLGNSPAGKDFMTNLNAQNNRARLDLLNQYGGTPEQIAQAITDRKNAPVGDTGMTVSQFQDNLKSAPQVDASGVVNWIDQTLQTGLGQDPVVRSSLSAIKGNILNQANKTAAGELPADGSILVSPDVLDGLRQNTNGYLRQYSSNGAVSSRQEAALAPLKDTLIQSINSGVPGYSDYLSTFAQHSVPINTMEAANKISELLDLGSRNASGDPILTLNQAKKAVQTIDQMPYGIHPEADQAIRNILGDLQRESASNAIRSPGSDTMLNSNLQNWMSQQLYGEGFSGRAGWAPKLAGALMGGLTGNVMGAAGGYLGADKLAGVASSKINNALVKSMSPDQAATILENYYAAQKPSQMAQTLRQLKQSPFTQGDQF